MLIIGEKINSSRKSIKEMVENKNKEFIQELARKNANIVLGTLKRVKDSYPQVKTIIGLSNISYGLPERRLINQSFMILTMASALDAAILDSTDKNLMALIKATDLLLGKDRFCTQYLKAFREGRL